MKKLLIAILAVSLIFVAGCGKNDNTDTGDMQTQQQEQQQQQKKQEQQDNDAQNDKDNKDEVNETDVLEVTGNDLNKLIETFNSETASEQQKEEARLKLEAIFEQAQANQ